MTGEYQGKNIYIQNPLSSDKINFCTAQVFLNERLVNTAPKTSAFEIDLSKLEIGGPVFIKIVHKEDCTPKVINPQVIRSKSKFQFLNVNADALSVHWSTIGELPYGKFFLEHYRNRKWINIETISGKGSFDANQYDILPDHHTGDNKYQYLVSYHVDAQSFGSLFILLRFGQHPRVDADHKFHRDQLTQVVLQPAVIADDLRIGVEHLDQVDGSLDAR